MSTAPNDHFQPISAFQMYKPKSSVKHKIKKRKRKQSSQQKQEMEISQKIKRKPRPQQNGTEPEEIPTLVQVHHSIRPEQNGEKVKSQTPRSETDDPTLDALNLFKWLIEPVSAERFFEEFWEQKALYIKRSNRNYFTHILNSSSLDKILRNNTLFYTRNVDVVSYENNAKQVYNPEGRAAPSALWDYYSNGCSIRILNPQTYSHKVHLLLATLQEYFGTMVGANVYLTPPGSQGFAPHYDDIEAFVIQLEGRKHWKLYQPKDPEVLARYSSPNLKHVDIGEPFMKVTLNAGEMLYFPRGTIHEGRTDPDSHSLHITVSVYQRTSYADLLEHIIPDALKTAAENNVEFRKGLPLNYLKNCGVGARSGGTSSLNEKVSDLMHSLVRYVDINFGVDQLGRKFMHDSMPPIPSKTEAGRSSKSDGPVLNDGDVVNRVEIDLDTKVRLLRYYCIRLVQERDSSPKLYYNTENATVYRGEEEQWLELDASMIPAIRLLQNTYPCYVEVEKLPMDDVAVKMQLVSDLWEHGLLVTEDPLETLDD